MWDRERGHDWGVGQWLAMSLMMLLTAALIAAAVLVVLHFVRVDRARMIGHPRQDERAGQILAERFARGEIDEQEFLRRRGLLRSDDR